MAPLFTGHRFGFGRRPFASSTGATITNRNGFTIHTFNSPGTFSVSCDNLPINYLVIGGGGASGSTFSNFDQRYYAGGGGAGGLRTGLTNLPIGSYTITIGDGGATAAADGNPSSLGNLITSSGGGGGGPSLTILNNVAVGGNGNPGGSGGGGGSGAPTPGIGNSGIGNIPSTSPPQGNPGSDGNSIATVIPDTSIILIFGGVGGGSATSGGTGVGPTAGNGTSVNIASVSEIFARGGNGGSAPFASNANPLSGDANTGDGGGSRFNSSTFPSPGFGAGGSGKVVIWYENN